jgi:hypothetical protein
VCQICLDMAGHQSGTVAILRPCAHRFCRECVQHLIVKSNELQWFGRTPLKCPVCRKGFDAKLDVMFARAQPDGGLVEEGGSALAAGISSSAGEAAPAIGSSSASLPTEPARAAGEAGERAHNLGAAVTITALPSLLSAGVAGGAAATAHSTGAPAARASTGLVGTAQASSSFATAGCLAALYDSRGLPAPAYAEDPELAVFGSYGTKIEALVRCIKALVVADGGERADDGAQDATVTAAVAAGSSVPKGDDDVTMASGGMAGAAAAPASSSSRRVRFADGDEGESNDGTSSVAAAVAAATRAPGGRPLQCLVFSQWDEALAICEAALGRNGIRCARFSSARKAADVLQQFIDDARIRVLLMPFKSGAEGLNITNASHVFLLEPLLEPALEQQAIGRVNRMGQMRPTFVHRFVIAGSVEQAVAALNRQKLQRQQRSALRHAPVHSHAAGSAGAGHGGASSRARRRGATGAAAASRRVMATDDDASSVGSARGGAASSSSSSSSDDDIEAKATSRDDAGGVTRGDIIRLFEAERTFERQLQEALEAATAGVRGADGAIGVTGVAVGARHGGLESTDAGSPARARGTGGGRPRKPAAAPAVTAGSSAPSMVLAGATYASVGGSPVGTRSGAGWTQRLHHAFWSQRVQHRSHAQPRLQVLTQLSWDDAAGSEGSRLATPAEATSSSGALPAATAVVTVFGRPVLQWAARRLLDLPPVTAAAAGRAATNGASSSSGGAAPDAAVAAGVAEEIARLRASLEI